MTGQRVGCVRSGVPDFVNAVWSDGLPGDKVYGWVENGWATGRDRLIDPLFRLLCETALCAGPTRVDIATGPGGGFAPCLLAIDPAASIMGSDAEICTIGAWARFLRTKGATPNAFFACFDACKMPFADECTDVVCSNMGFTNVPYHNLALSEAFRVLRRGGLLVAREEQAVESSGQVIPELLGSQAFEVIPGVIDGWVELARSLGFGIEQHHVWRKRLLDPDDSGLAKIAAAKGLQVEVETHYIVARK